VKRVSKHALTWALSLGVLAYPAVVCAGVHQVWDEAHLFKAETLLDVEPVLLDIDAKYYKDLMIETFPSIPDDLKNAHSTQDMTKFYEGWSIVEGNALKVNGILIIITAQSRHLHVYVGLDTRKKAFTLADRDELVNLLTTAFKARNYDGGLLDGVKFVRDRMAKNLAEAPATQPTSPTSQATSQPSQPATRPAPVSK
jgi:uncharacterized membrane protein YgcG